MIQVEHYAADPKPMTTKQWLKQVRTLEMQVESTMEQIKRMRSILTRCTQMVSDTPSGGRRSDWTDTLLELQTAEADLQEQVHQWLAIRKQVADAIAALENPMYRQLLEYRYLNCMSWTKIASKMHYSPDYLQRMHANAIRQISVPPKK